MRTVWFLAGGAAGVYATSKARQVVEALSYDGVHDRLTGWFAGARVLRDELRAGMAEKEVELQEQLALTGGARVLALPAADNADSDTDDTTDHRTDHRTDHTTDHTTEQTTDTTDESRGHH